jgi:hypothetical protein
MHELWTSDSRRSNEVRAIHEWKKVTTFCPSVRHLVLVSRCMFEINGMFMSNVEYCLAVIWLT